MLTRTILFKAFLMLAAILFTLAILRPGEPRYQGRRISTWIRELRGNGPQRTVRAEEAIRAIGTNAIPFLRLKLRSEDSRLKLGLVKILWMQDRIKVRILLARGWHMRAALACEVLGTMARPLVPDLLRMAGTDFVSFEVAVGALSHMGEDAVPGLTRALTDLNPRIRQASARALGAMGPPAKDAIPALIKSLHDSDVQVRSESSLALGAIGIASGEVVDGLAGALLDANSDVRDNVVDVLAQFGKQAKGALPTLLRLLSDPDELVRTDATNAFRSIEIEGTENAE